jgi:hypothetical protein
MWWALVAAKLAVDIQLSKYCGLARLVSSTPYIQQCYIYGQFVT